MRKLVLGTRNLHFADAPFPRFSAIETKSHKGWVFGRENDKKWTQSLEGGNKYLFHNPIIQNANHVKYIQKITNIESNHLSNIVVFSNPEMEIKSTLPKYVLRLRDLKAYIEQNPCNRLHTQRLHEIIGCIEFSRKDRSLQTNENHIAYVKKKYNL